MITERSVFFVLQRLKRWRWPWLILSFIIGVGFFWVTTLVMQVIVDGVADAGLRPAKELSAHLETDDNARTPTLLIGELLLVGVPFWAGAIAAVLVHGRSPKALINPARRFDWSIIAKVLSIQALLAVVTIPLMTLTGWPELTEFTLRDVSVFLPIALVVLIQTSGEDVFFKGYMLRQLGAATALTWLAPVVVSSVFVALHIGNSDFQSGFWMLLVLFFLSELMICYLTSRTGGMEMALASHWFNNAVIFLLIAERETQSNDVTVFVFDNDDATLSDDYVGNALYLVLLGVQLAAYLWPKSPWHLPRYEPKPAVAPQAA